MSVRVVADFFSDADRADQDLAAHGLHRVVYDVPPVKNTAHWHEFSTRIYILAGELNITDCASGETVRAGPGALVEVPARVLHAEYSPQGYKIIAGLSVHPDHLSPPVDRSPELLQKSRGEVRP